MLKRNNGYIKYLTYKQVIDLFENQNCTRNDLAKLPLITYVSAYNIITILINEEVIELFKYINEDGHKRAVYRLIKNI